MERNGWFFVSCPERTDIIEGTYEDVKMKDEGGIYTSRSGPYDTKETLYKDCDIQPFPCKECGKLISARLVEPVRSEIIAQKLCHSCHFWTGKLPGLNDPNVFVVNGGMYKKYPDTNDKGFKGFGGRLFKMLRPDGKIVESKNMWHSGTVPEIFRDRIKDNAVFVENL